MCSRKRVGNDEFCGVETCGYGALVDCKRFEVTLEWVCIAELVRRSVEQGRGESSRKQG